MARHVHHPPRTDQFETGRPAVRTDATPRGAQRPVRLASIQPYRTIELGIAKPSRETYTKPPVSQADAVAVAARPVPRRGHFAKRAGNSWLARRAGA